MDARPIGAEKVTDIHSGLNFASMHVHRPSGIEEVRALIEVATRGRHRLTVCGGRHSMGGQQFADGGMLIDLRDMNHILTLDTDRGLVRAEAGIEWPELIDGLLAMQRELQPSARPRWAIAQKQTGGDNFTLGGSLSSNIHGRGLRMGPIVADVESFTLILPNGRIATCSRGENTDLFALAIGGYGLFGVIVDVTLRLAARRTLRRVVRVVDIDEAVSAAQRRIQQGFLYGDFQFDIDPRSPEFLTKGVFSAYCPVDGDPEPPPDQKALSKTDWTNLLTMAHTEKAKAFTLYAQHYIATDGQFYSTDSHQISDYIQDYHDEVDRRINAPHRGSEMITELFVPHPQLVDFLHQAARLLIERESQVIYGTIRLILPDTETVLAWARDRYACVIFNLHIDHVAAAIDRAADTFRELIDLAIGFGGSYYLTYHRFATPEQLEKCYPRIRDFFDAKRRIDPQGVFQSDWYTHYAPHFTEASV